MDAPVRASAANTPRAIHSGLVSLTAPSETKNSDKHTVAIWPWSAVQRALPEGPLALLPSD